MFRKGQDKKAMWNMVIVGMLVVAFAAAVYNADTLYDSTKKNDIIILSSSTLAAGAENDVVVMIQDKAGKPLQQDFSVYLETGAGSELVYNGRTGADGMGFATFSAPGAQSEASIMVKAGSSTLEKQIRLKAQDDVLGGRRLVITTDKPIYQPGQDIYSRVLALEAGSGVVEGSVLLEIITPEGDKIVHEEMVLNDHGVAAHSLALGSSLPLGEYTLKYTLDGVSWEKKVRVEKYVLPRFEMSIGGLKAWYMGDEEIALSFKADYFFGKPVNGNLNIKTEIYNPVYYGWEEPWTGDIMEPEVREEGQTEPGFDGDDAISSPPTAIYDTDDNYNTWTLVNSQNTRITDGQAAIRIPAIEGYTTIYGTHALRFNVTVTDTAFHEETKSYYSVVSSTPIVVSVLGETAVEGYPSRYHVLAQSPDGKPLPDAGILIGGVSTSTDSWGVASISMPYAGENTLDIAVDSGDYDTTITLPLYDWRGSLKATSDRVYYEMGNKANITVYDEYLSSEIYWEAKAGGRNLQRGRLTTEGGTANFELSITPEMTPAVEIRIFRTSGSPAVDSLILNTRAGSGLNVMISSNRAVYAPGDSVQMKITASNMESGVPGMAGVSIVDRAVLELGDRYMGLEGVVFEESYFNDPRLALAYYIGDPEFSPMPEQGIARRIYQDDSSSTMSATFLAGPPQAFKEAASTSLLLLIPAVVISLALVYIVSRKEDRRAPAVAIVVVMVMLGTAFVTAAVLSVSVQQYTQEGGVIDVEPSREAVFNEPEVVSDDPQEGSPAMDFSSEKETAGGFTGSRGEIRTRTFFPETWLWEPYVILDDNGEAELNITAPDSLTSWEIRAVASTTDGEVGMGRHNITVYQDFFIEPDLPYDLLMDDIITIPVTLYNYGMDRNVSVSIDGGSWLDILSPANVDVDVDRDTVTAVNFTVSPRKVGVHILTSEALADDTGDRVERVVRVRPGGLRNTTVHNGVLENTSHVEENITFDHSRIPGSEQLYVKLQAGLAAVALDGAEGFIQQVVGCGEQSLSLLSIDILAYKHLRDTDPNHPKLPQFKSIVEKGIQYELQYVKKAQNGQGRGIVWFPGEADVHPWLTSWGLVALSDAVEAGFYVDPAIIGDMRTWLSSQQKQDGSWAFPDWGLYETTNALLLQKEAAATAYITRALLRGGMPASDPAVSGAMSYLAQKAQAYSTDAYTAALMLLVLEMGAGDASARSTLANGLQSAAIWSGGSVHWESMSSMTTYGYYYSESKNIETTGYAVLALRERGVSSLVTAGIKHLLDSRSSMGIFHSTQDTIVAFQAIAKAGSLQMEAVNARVLLDGVEVRSMGFDRNVSDITYYVDLEIGQNTTNALVRIETDGIGQILYQIIYSEHINWTSQPGGISLNIRYDQNATTRGGVITASAALAYNGSEPVLQMVLVEVYAPTGFSLMEKDFDILLENGNISYYDRNPLGYNLYFQPVKTGDVIVFEYHLLARFPVQTIAQGGKAYDMYNPSTVCFANPVPMVVEL